MGGFLPAGASERAEMLREIGCGSIDELFSPIPQEVRLKGLDIPQGMSELQAQRALRAMAKKNKVFDTIFRGAGAYRHYIPAVVGSVTGKEEFLTAYTPYQAEISQGVLQSIFEYQTMICELTGMEVSNASVYDGATAAAEAAAMCRERGRGRVLVSSAAHPEVIETMRTYCFGCGMELTLIPERGGRTDLRALGGLLGRVLTVSTKGIEFVMTALFVTIFTGQWMEDREHRPALVGLGASVLCLALFGAGNFILPAMALIVLLLLVMRPALDKKGAVR